MRGTRKKVPTRSAEMRSELAAAPSAELVARWRGGDQDAATEIFERYLDRLTALARARLSAKLAARVDADDIVMSAYRSFFVAARGGRFVLDGKGSLWRLLVEITLHKLYRTAAHHRARKRATTKETGSESTSVRAIGLVAREPGPDEVAAVADELEAILAQLPPLGRRTLELRLQGLERSEIAHELSCSDKTVRRWLDRVQQLFDARDTRGGTTSNASDLQLRRRRVGPATPGVGKNRRSKPRLPRNRLQFGDYQLRRMIGAGASGKVYIASSRLLGVDVAVKFLRKTFALDRDAIDRFLAEACLLKRMRHRGIIRVHGIGADRSGYFFVMDLATGGDLSRVIQQAPVPCSRAVTWIIEAAEAIGHAHRNNIIHCDLKPSNLLLDSDGRIIVTDFGLARSISDSTPVALAGTPAFMAPEQVTTAWGPIGPATDIYGLGSVLYALITGRPPVPGTRVADILAQIASGAAIIPADSLRADVPTDLSEICLRCLSKRPTNRPASASELIDALRSIEYAPISGPVTCPL